MNEFKQKMFPDKTNKAVLEDGLPHIAPQPKDLPLDEDPTINSVLPNPPMQKKDLHNPVIHHPEKLKVSPLRQLLTNLGDSLKSSEWDRRGYAYLFFDVRKTPRGILEIRAALNKTMSDQFKLDAIKKIAKNRLAHPPIFTKRDQSVRELYQKIAEINKETLDDTVANSFKHYAVASPYSTPTKRGMF